jgi:hypothetical protein
MKYTRKKIVVIILFVLLGGLIINAMFTMGIVFDCHGGFESSSTNIFEDIFIECQRATIRLGENPNNPIAFIPFVFWLYGIEAPPYTILLEITDDSQSLVEIFIESILIEYVDGERKYCKVDWKGVFDKTISYNFEDSKLIEISVTHLKEKLPVTVDRRNSCTINFVGYFVNNKGTKIQFDTIESFKYENIIWRIYPAGAPL